MGDYNKIIDVLKSTNKPDKAKKEGEEINNDA